MGFQNILVRQNRIVILISKGRNLKEERDDRSHANSELSISNSIRCLENNPLWFSALPSRPIGEAVYPMALWGSHAPRHWAITLLLRHWVVASWFSILKPRRPHLLKPVLPSGPVVGVAALPSLNQLCSQASLFLKDISCLC